MKLSDLTPDDWFSRLNKRRLEQNGEIRRLWEYYEGNQPLYFVARILEEQQNRFPALTINWCGKFVDMLDARCMVDGFRLAGADQNDDKLWDIWQRNNFDEEQSENNIASLVTGISYVMAGPSAEGALYTVESPHTVAVERDVISRRLIAGLKVWKSDPEQAIEDMAELYVRGNDGEPSRIYTFESGKRLDGGKALGWMKSNERLQSSPMIPIVDFPNQKLKGKGRSVMKPLIPIVDAANQIATNMMAGAEHHATPRKWIVGANKSDFVGPDGKPLSAWQIATGAVWVNSYDDKRPNAPKPEVGQFAATDLRNFHDTLSTLGRIGAGLCDLAPSTFGFGISDNPPSADSIRAAKDDWISRLERIQTARGNGYEQLCRIGAAIEDRDPATLVGLETVWRDAGAPTKDAAADRAVKTYAAGISDLRQAREDYGYTDTQIKQMEQRASAASEDDPLVRATRELLNANGDNAQSGG